MTFLLDPRLANLSHSLAEIAGLDIRLANDSRYIWLYIVPQLPNISELEDIPAPMRDEMLSLATHLSAELKTHYKADKMNIAAIGNIVPQFHLHIVARHIGDEAWPDPIWGRGTMQPYSDAELSKRKSELQKIVATWL